MVAVAPKACCMCSHACGAAEVRHGVRRPAVAAVGIVQAAQQELRGVGAAGRAQGAARHAPRQVRHQCGLVGRAVQDAAVQGVEGGVLGSVRRGGHAPGVLARRLQQRPRQAGALRAASHPAAVVHRGIGGGRGGRGEQHAVGALGSAGGSAQDSKRGADWPWGYTASREIKSAEEPRVLSAKRQVQVHAQLRGRHAALRQREGGQGGQQQARQAQCAETAWRLRTKNASEMITKSLVCFFFFFCVLVIFIMRPLVARSHAARAAPSLGAGQRQRCPR